MGGRFGLPGLGQRELFVDLEFEQLGLGLECELGGEVAERELQQVARVGLGEVLGAEMERRVWFVKEFWLLC